MLLERAALDLALPLAFVEGITRSASYRYKTFAIAKRGGGARTIHHPSRQLKALQRWLASAIINELPVHPAAMAYRPGIGIAANARAHAASRYLLRMDFEEFFGSITEADIRAYIAAHSGDFAGWSAEDISAFCSLVCRHGVLTVGAPSSPALSNAICFELDSALDGQASANRIRYTRYADDLFFSTVQRDSVRIMEEVVPRCCSELPFPRGLRVNRTKTRHSSKRGARKVTGLTLGSDGGVYVGRHFKRQVRAMIFRMGTLSAAERRQLGGWITYAMGIDPDFINSLIAKYGLTRVQEAREPE